MTMPAQATTSHRFDPARTEADADHLLRVIAVHFAASEAAEHHQQPVEARIDSDGLITLRGGHEACERALLNLSAKLAGVRSDCELAEAMGLGVHFVLGPPAALDGMRGLLGLPMRFIHEARAQLRAVPAARGAG